MSDEEAKKALEKTVEQFKKESLKVPNGPPYCFDSYEEKLEWAAEVYKNMQKPFGWYEKHSKEVADLNRRFQYAWQAKMENRFWKDRFK